MLPQHKNMCYLTCVHFFCERSSSLPSLAHQVPYFPDGNTQAEQMIFFQP